MAGPAAINMSTSSAFHLALVLLMFLVAVSHWEHVSSSYAKPQNQTSTANVERPPEGNSSKPTGGRRQLDLVDGTLGLVGHTFLGLGGRAKNGPRVGWSLYRGCPLKPNAKHSDVLRVFMLLHRIDDPLDEELKIEEFPGANEWDRSSIDTMVREGNFKLNRPTLLYTGGFLQDSKERWLRSIRRNFDSLYRGNASGAYNLLFFDWSDYSMGDYGRAVSYVPHIAQKLANFFEHLRANYNYNLDGLHLISFSLSTHIAGLAGRQLAKRQPVGQITYIDPTGVCFHDGREFGQKYAARPDDAAFTVAKHYNMFGLGAYQFIGGLDIIVNGGRSQPPMGNSLSMGSMFNLIGGSILTSHLRASIHETEPFRFKTDCHELAYECTSYDSFLAGECGSCGKNNESCYLIDTVASYQMGHDPRKVPYRPGTKMFLSTGKSQFCVYQYQVVIELKQRPTNDIMRSFSSGDFVIDPSEGVKVAPSHLKGRRLYQLLTLNNRIGAFRSTIGMGKHGKLLAYIDSVKIRYLSHLSPVLRSRYSIKYCPDRKSQELVQCA